MDNFVILGECLVELSWDRHGNVCQGFAGDVYSVAVYLKRAAPRARVRLLCAIGRDFLSDSMLASLDREGVETSLLLRHPSRNLGLYAIQTTADGERQFTYWRSESAARLTLTTLAESPDLLTMDPPGAFYLTGITLAILEDRDQLALWKLLRRLRRRGTQIIFDTNYRPALWSNRDTAQSAFERALSISDLVLPGVEDMDLLFGLGQPESICAYLHKLGVKAMVLKNGAADIFYGSPTAPRRYAIKPVARVMDTTAAGDSFGGTLLGAISRGVGLEEAIASAAAMSARVIQHRGAILPDGQVTTPANP